MPDQLIGVAGPLKYKALPTTPQPNDIVADNY